MYKLIKQKNNIMKQRPFSANNFVSHIPIYIDQKGVEQIPNKQLTTEKSEINKLSYIVPQMPAFPLKATTSANLYSKFVVKGLKDNKIPVVRNALEKKIDKRKNKAAENETAHTSQHKIVDDGITSSFHYLNERSNRHQSKRNQNSSHNNRQTSYINEVNIDFINDDTQIIENNYQKSFVRSSSAKVFNRANRGRHQTQNQMIQLNQNTRVMRKSQTQKRLKRPKTAKNPYTNSFKKETTDYRQASTKRQTIERTSSSRVTKSQVKKPSFERQENLETLFNKKIGSIFQKGDDLITIKEQKGKNFINRNYKNVSNYSKKSIYLTNFEEPPKSKQQQALADKLSRTVLQKISKAEYDGKNKGQSEKSNEEMKQLQRLQGQRQSVIQQLVLHKEKMKYYDEKYEDQEIIPQHSVGLRTIRATKANDALGSKGLDDDRQQMIDKNKQTFVNDKEMIDCYSDYIQKCNIVQLQIKQQLSNNKKEQSKENEYVFNVWEIAEIMDLGRQIETCNQMLGCDQNIVELKGKFHERVRNLKYFKNRNVEDQRKIIHDLRYRLTVVPEGQVILQLNQEIQSIYVIINGSVKTTKILNQPKQQWQLNDEEIIKQIISYFDGQSFGEPSRICLSQRAPKSQIEAVALQQTVIMKINYEDYLNKFLSGSDLQQKLKVLELVFDSQITNGLMKKNDLEMLAFNLQKKKYQGKSLVFRQNQQYQDLIFVKHGTLKYIRQTILMREKPKIKDVKQKDKALLKSKQKQDSLKQIYQSKSLKKFHKIQGTQDKQLKIQDHRKHNLFDYDPIRETAESVYFYKMTEIKKFIIGDGINWEAFDGIDKKTKMAEEESIVKKMNGSFKELLESPIKNNFILPFTPEYSLLSDSDITEIYVFSKSCFKYLPVDLRKILVNKISLFMKAKANPEPQNTNKKINLYHKTAQDQREQDPVIWDNYKQKICKQVLQDKKSKKLIHNNWIQ